MPTSPIDSRPDPYPLKIGDKIKMRGPDGIEREGTFLGSLMRASIAEAPLEHLKVSDDLTLVRQGPLYRFEGPGAGKLSLGAHTLLMSAFDAGEDVAADYLKGFSAGSDHPLYEDQSLTLDQMRAMAQRAQTPSTVEPTAADELLKVLQQYTQPRHSVAAGEAYVGTDKGDAIAAADGARISSNEGDDWIDGRDKLTANGGSGNDLIEAYENATLVGGHGNDKLTAYGTSSLDGGTGNDHLAACDHARISGGAGHDYIHAYSHARIEGGSGNDYISVYGHSTVDGGDGHDFIMAGDNGQLSGGLGNDMIRANDNVTISGGQGDDALRVGRDAQIRFNRGDGTDTIEAARGARSEAIAKLTDRTLPETLASGRIVFGPGIGPGNLTITREGDDLRIALDGGNDALIIRDTAHRGTPGLIFADGSSLSGTAVQERAVIG